MLSFSNAVVTVKEDVIVDDSIFSAPLYAKLMLRKGVKFDDALACADAKNFQAFLENFYISEKGEHIRCEAFSRSQVTGAVISHESFLWCNLSVNANIKCNRITRIFFAELVQYQFNPDDAEELSFTK